MDRPSRRDLLAGGGLMVLFAFGAGHAQLAGGGEGGPAPKALRPDLPGSLKSSPRLDSWIKIEPSGKVTVFSGKAELGQGIRTALLQVAAEELDLPPASITFITADTTRTPDEGLTAGSHSMQDGGTALANAGANVRLMLRQAAAKTWGIAIEALTTDGRGFVIAPDGRKLGYGTLAATLNLKAEVIVGAPRRDPRSYRTLGRDLPRVDIPAKVSGGQAFVQDIKLPGMLHARVARGPSHGTALIAPDIAAVRKMPGVLAVVQRDAFLSVVAKTEWQAVQAMRRLQAGQWRRTGPAMPAPDEREVLRSLPSRLIEVQDTRSRGSKAKPDNTVHARYSRPWISHGSIGPSCAVAQYLDGELTIWSHSQGVFDVHRSVAQLVGMSPERVRCTHSPSAGCYGQNGADDAAADAAMIALAVPGRPIRLQWMREQEFGWEPLGPAMLTELSASIGHDGIITAWSHAVWSNPHNNRPVDAGGFLTSSELSPGFPPPPPKPIPMPEGDGDRNANPLYVFANSHVIYHFVPQMPLRVSALRSLGAHLNVFSIESMLDELALSIGRDPLDVRLTHMQDERARAVMQAVAQSFGWRARTRGDGRRGYGMAFARYKNIGAYCAIMLEVEVERDTGKIRVGRVHAAVDAGQAASPDGVRNQVEGGIVQSLSWATHEAVTFDASRRTSFDWGSYPISRFKDVPEEIVVDVLPRPGMPFLGAGETSQGPASAALANAIADATGVRLRDMPLTPAKLREAIGI